MDKTSWKQWLTNNQISGQDATVLREAIDETIGGTPSNGSVRVVRSSVEEKMIQSCEPYVDAHGLLPLYDKLCFRENLIIKGPKGDGKSLSIFHYAYINGIPLIVVECSENHHKRDFVGSFYLQGMETPFILGDIPTAIDIANEAGMAILLFEELNSLTPQTQKQLNGMLDFRQRVGIPQIGKTFQLHPQANLWSVATMNPSAYGGTYELNDDLRSRFDECEVSYPSATKEKEIIWANLNNAGNGTTLSNADQSNINEVIRQAIKLANETRKGQQEYALSSRDLVRFVRDVQIMGLAQACQLLVCKFENNDRDTAVRRVSSHFKGVRVKRTWGSGAAPI